MFGRTEKEPDLLNFFTIFTNVGPSIYHRVKLPFSFGVNRIVGFLASEKYEVRSSFVSASRTHHFVREEPINNTKHKRLKSEENNAIVNRRKIH